MAILLINAPTAHENSYLKLSTPKSYMDFRKQFLEGKTEFYPLEPLGLLSIKSYCENSGVTTHYINGIANQDTTIDATCETISQLHKSTKDEILLIGLTGASSVFHENLTIARRCRSFWPKAKIILGSDFAALNYQRILESHPEIDFICLGDGEILCYELHQQLLTNHKDFPMLSNLAWRNSANKVTTSKIEATDIDLLPTPARDDLLAFTSNNFPATIYTSRGCPFRCSFCTTGQVSAQLGGGTAGYRLRDISKVIDEVETLYKQHQVKNLMIVDDLFLTRSSLSKNRALTFANELIRRKIKINYMFDCRLDSVDLDLFKELRKSGLKQVFLGIESGSRTQRADYNKKLKELRTPEMIIQQLEAIGIHVIYGMITFHPLATLDELAENIRLIERLPGQRVNLLINKMIPYPGTPIFEKYKEAKLIDESNWPIINYQFQAPAVNDLYHSLVKKISEDNPSFQELKQHFIDELKRNKAW